MKFLIGTYTKGQSKGIYEMELINNSLVNYKLVIETANPTYLDYDKENACLYSVYGDGSVGGINCYKENEGVFNLEYSITEAGAAPCYVRVDDENGYVYDANYHKGSVTVYKNDANYHKGSVTVYKNDGIEKVFQYLGDAHAHYVDMDPKTNDLFVCDLGNDVVHKYRLLNEIATFNFPKGTGPRHIAFHPKLNVLYVFGELNNTITVLEDDEFEFNELQSISTVDSKILNGGAAIKISSDGSYLYASNRSDNTLAVFKINELGYLTKIQSISTYGEHPRDFEISPDGLSLIVANLKSNSLSLFSINKETGLLALIESGIEAFEPVCIKFK